MNTDTLFAKIDERVALDKDEGDIAYFFALSLELEFITKLTISATIACIGDDSDRHRYSLEHRLIRSDSTGDWITIMMAALTGPPAQFFDHDAHDIVRDLTERVGNDDWRHHAVSHLSAAAHKLDVNIPAIGRKVALRQFFEIGAALRNRTRGHGAVTSDQCSNCCIDLATAINLVRHRLQVFRKPWVYLSRNLSGKYRIISLMGDPSAFAHLRTTRDIHHSDGVYLHVRHPVRVSLVFFNRSTMDVFLPNGNFSSGRFDVLSYITNENTREDSSPWSTPPSNIPGSVTEGFSSLGQIGNSLSNLPPSSGGYVQRTQLESRLSWELSITDRHPIVSLTGSGGIGKTTLALTVINQLARRSPPPYEVIIWISARDIDLLESGPKPVAPGVVSQKEIAKVMAELVDSSDTSPADPESAMRMYLSGGALGAPTLLVLDNFETVEKPGDVFDWIDACVRPPNKVLITTRFRNFKGDYPLEVRGMTDD